MADFELHETPEHITDMIYQAMLGEQVFVTLEGRRIVLLLPLENGRSLPPDQGPLP